jgi:hypothetical protein
MFPVGNEEAHPMTRYARCFSEDFDHSKPHVIMDAGIRVLEVSKIVGTVDKCGELDANFQYVSRSDRSEISRRNRLEEAVKKYHFFPAIDVYQYRGRYYVEDGNRRVATVRALKIDFIDAHVKEYILKEDEEALAGALARRRFESETGLRNIKLVHERGYEVLYSEIGRYPLKDGITQKAKQWYSGFYLDSCKKIQQSPLPEKYPDLNVGDIFVIIMQFYREFMKTIPENVRFETLISGFMFARMIPQKRLYRLFPFRFIRGLIFGEKRGFEPLSGEHGRRNE